MPEMMATETPRPPKTTEPDDIADPPVPAEALQKPAESPTLSAEEKTAADTSQTQIVENIHAGDAMAHGFLQWLQKEVHKTLTEEKTNAERALDYVFVCAKALLEKAATQNEHSEYLWSDALVKFKECFGLVGAPYSAGVHAISPQGIPVTLTIAKREAKDLIEALPALLGWLQEQGYQGKA